MRWSPWLSTRAAAEAAGRRGCAGHPAAARARRRAPAGPAAMTASRSLSLTRSSSAPRTTVSPLRAGRGDEEHRKLVDRQRHQRLGHLDAAQRDWRAPRCRRPARAAGSPRRAACTRDVRAHQLQHLEQPGAGRVDADVARSAAAARAARHAGDQEERRRGEIRRHLDAVPLQRAGRPRGATVAPLALDLRRRRRAACARCDRAWAPAR